MNCLARRMSGRIAAAAFAGVMLLPVAIPLALAQPAAAQTAAPAAPCKGNGNGNGNGNGGNPHCNTTTTVPATTTTAGGTTTTTCAYPFNNCTTTTTAAGPQPIIIISVTVAIPGETLTVTVCGYAPGAVVRITLNGNVVLQIVIPNGNPATCTTQTTIAPPVIGVLGPIGHALVHAQAAHTSGATGQFQVPTDTPPGSYLVCAESAGMPTPCKRLNVASRNASVLGNSFSRGAPLVSASNPDSFLAFSGMGLVRLLCLAGALMGLGWFLVRRSNPRRA